MFIIDQYSIADFQNAFTDACVEACLPTPTNLYTSFREIRDVCCAYCNL